MAGEAFKGMPEAIDVERSVLASCIILEDSLDRVIETLDKFAFYRTSHQHYFEAIRVLYLKNAPVNLVTVSSYLKDKKLTDVASLGELAEITDAPVSVNLEHHINTLREKYALRKSIEICNAGTKRCQDSRRDPSETLEYIKSEMAAIEVDPEIEKSLKPVSGLVGNAVERYDKLSSGEIPPGLKTGFLDLDRIVSLYPGDAIVLAARPSMGKTAFALNVMLNQNPDTPIAFFTLEQGRDRIIDRMVSIRTRIDLQKIIDGEIEGDDWDKIDKFLGSLADRRIFIDDTSPLTMAQIAARSRRMKRNEGLELIIIDYLQLVKSEYRRDQNRNLEVGSDMKAAKALAKELHLPVIVIAQLNRNLEKRPNPNKVPMLSDLRDSGEIEQDADVVMFAYRPEVYQDTTTGTFENQANIYVSKQRDGKLGVAELLFIGENVRFQDHAHNYSNRRY